ncbi:MAG: hypothetical protein N3B16_11495 [Candidatus Aminicenantes bacterium]|nr:hypothetical protein [Candidatus Aminicenantes bacterium]
MPITTAKIIVLILFGLAFLALVISIFRRETDNIIRSLIFSLVLGILFYYFETTKMEQLTINNLKRELGLAKPVYYNYIKEESKDLYKLTVRYFFPEPGPRLNLTIDPSGRYLHLDDIDEVNQVLEYIGLKKVTHGAKELASITGSQLDVNLYQWDDYPDGILVIERAICRDKETFNSYNCLQSITLTRRR